MCNDLSWNYHFSEIVRKANYEINKILHSFLYSDVSVHTKALHCCVRSLIEYNCFVRNSLLCCNIYNYD